MADLASRPVPSSSVFSSGFFPSWSFSKVPRCPGQSTWGSAGVTCATAVLSIQPKARKTYLKSSRVHALFLDMWQVQSSREEVMESRLFSIMLPCAYSFFVPGSSCIRMTSVQANGIKCSGHSHMGVKTLLQQPSC